MHYRENPQFEDAEIALKLYDLRRETEMRKARNLIGTVVATAETDDVLAMMQYEHPENAHLRQVVGYWEMVASLVLRGLLHPAVYLDWCGEGLFTLVCFQPHMEKIRERYPHYFRKTEEIARDVPALRERVQDLTTRINEWRAQRAAAEAAAKSKRKTRKPTKKKPGRKSTKRKKGRI